MNPFLVTAGLSLAAWGVVGLLAHVLVMVPAVAWLGVSAFGAILFAIGFRP